MEKNDFFYYFHKTRIVDPSVIEDIFNNGLTSWYGTSLHSTIYRIDNDYISEVGLKKAMDAYLGDSEHYNAVFLFKIPKRYMSGVLHRNGSIDPPVPLIKQNEDNTVSITSSLIQGVYCSDKNISFTNPNFSPVFDPSGLKYSDEQIDNLWFANRLDWIKFAKSRENYSYNVLKNSDTKNKTWDWIIQYYSSKYKEKIKSHQNFCICDEDKALFNSQKL